MADITEADIERRFHHHVPVDEQVRAIHDDMRDRFALFALQIAAILPEGREKSLAFTALEESSFWAHAAVARKNAPTGRYADDGPGKFDRIREAKGG